ncbi:MAG: hypothetical protein KBF68_10050, partial [Nitrosomonas sp.]|nr:hypothetical protein [Nitrosomonas sp.]
RPGEHADGLGQPVLAAQAAADYLRGVSAQNTLRADDEAQTGGFGGKIPSKNELPGIFVQKTDRITGKSENR